MNENKSLINVAIYNQSENGKLLYFYKLIKLLYEESMGIYILFVFLLIIFLINVQINNKFFGAPAVVFSFSFLMSSIWACAYAQKWELYLHINTFIVISSGVLIFSIVCLLTKYVDHVCCVGYSQQIGLNNTLDVSNCKLLLFIAFDLINMFYRIEIIKDVTGAKSLSNAISKLYAEKSMLYLPFIVRQISVFIGASGYWFSFVLVNNYLINKRIQWLLVAAIGISVVSGSFWGSRGGPVCILLSIPAFFLLLSYRKNKRNRKIEIKKIAFAILVLGAAIWCFPKIGDLLGRTTNIESGDYIAAYIGAEIKNLDLFLRNAEIPGNHGTWGSTVFGGLEMTLSKYFSFPLRIAPSPNGFNHVNGYFLGNVYTIFYDFLYDFGYIGNYVIVIILAFANQKIFDNAEKKKIKNKIPIIMIVYGYMFPLILFSFFAYWFGNSVVSAGFVEHIVYWNLLNILFFRVKLFSRIRLLQPIKK